MLGYYATANTNDRCWRILVIKVVAAFSEWPIELGQCAGKTPLTIVITLASLNNQAALCKFCTIRIVEPSSL